MKRRENLFDILKKVTGNEVKTFTLFSLLEHVLTRMDKEVVDRNGFRECAGRGGGG